MPKYTVVCVGRDTSRRRRRVVEARDEAHAKALAEAEGTLVESIERLPEEPATDAQLAYARDLGISFPTGATKHELSDLLSAHLEHDKPADSRHLAFADFYGVSYTQFTGKKSVYRRIFATLSEAGREQDLAAWFAYRVYRALLEDRENAAVAEPSDAAIQAVAAELTTDESVLKSIRRYEGTDLIWFGEWTAPDGSVHSGGSNQTIAYKRSAALLRELLPSELRQRASRVSAVNTEQAGDTQAPASRRGGCASVVGAVVLGVVVVLGILQWVNRLVA